MINSLKYCTFFFEKHFEDIKDIISDIKNIINNTNGIISDKEQLCHKPHGLLVNMAAHTINSSRIERACAFLGLYTVDDWGGRWYIPIK